MAGSLAQRLLTCLEAHQGEMTALLTRLVGAESPSAEGAAQGGAQTILVAALREHGFRVRHLRGRESGGVLYAAPTTRRRGLPHQLLLGHSDTVWPVGTLEEMPIRVEHGRFHGPGGYDMKAGLVQGLFAVAALGETGALPLAVTPVFLVNSDEEIGSRESTHHIRRLARGADRVLVLEPSMGPDGHLKTARKGLGRFTVHVSGKAAHAGLDPERGVSAILELAHVIQGLFALNDAGRGITVNVGTIDGGIQPNVIAPESRAVADVRVRTHEDGRLVSEAIRSLRPSIEGTTLRIEGGFGRPPMEPTPGNRTLWALALEAAGEIGIGLEQETAGGGSDGNTTSQFAPTLDGLGAVGGGAHATNEFLVLDKMVERAALLAILLSHGPLGAEGTTP